MTTVNIYCRAVGAELTPEGPRYTGPNIVALNLYKALSRHSSLDFVFYTTRPSVVEASVIRPFHGVMPGRVNHALNSLELAEACVAAPHLGRVVVGPNVLFTFPGGDLEANFDERYSEEARDHLARENAIASAPWDFLLLPSFAHESTMNRRLRGRRLGILPCGIDDELFSPSPGEKAADVLIMGKGKYSDPETFRLATAMAEELYELLKHRYVVSVVNRYEYPDYPALLAQHKIAVHTTPGETQGIALMESQAAGVPVVHREGIPFQPPELAKCRRSYSAAELAAAVPGVLSDLERLAAAGVRFVRDGFSLRHMAKEYCTLLGLERS